MRLFRFVPSLRKEVMRLEPTPAKKQMPEWYRLGESTIPGGHGEEEAPGMKSCIPFLDILLLGYTIVTPFDIFVGRNEDGSLSIRWNGPREWGDFVGERPKELGQTIPRPPGHMPNGLVWSTRWGWKTPKGWSVIVTHPFNRHDLPFTTLSGIIESDLFIANGNIPFFIKEDFIGTIPAGTPYAQLVPVKRKSWKAIMDYGLFGLSMRQGSMVRNPETSYKHKLWKRKEYN